MTKKKALLIVGLTLLLATAGVVYAHWTASLNVSADVTTGSVQIHWKNLFTDDDGSPNAGYDNEVVVGTYTYGTPSSADPSSAGPNATRYAKDVADCVATGVGSDTFVLTANNVYPSYHCTMWSTFGNQGSVPVKLQSIVTTTYKNGVPNYDLTGEGTWQTLDGTLCGLQIDPGAADNEMTINTFHIEQGATPGGALYQVRQTLNFVNWNEWKAADCFHTFNGTASRLPVEP